MQDRIMHVDTRRRIVRFLAWSCLVGLAFAICQNSALAQGVRGTVEVEEDGFFDALMHSIITFDNAGLMQTLRKPQFAWPAFIALNVIIFTETGLLLGFFLPGDSLLVIVGLICANPACPWNLPLLLVSLCAAAIVGDSVGYSIGYKTGPKIFNREKSFFFNKDHLVKAQQFYKKPGGVPIILARMIVPPPCFS